jgi:hypothetical protein
MICERSSRLLGLLALLLCPLTLLAAETGEPPVRVNVESISLASAAIDKVQLNAKVSLWSAQKATVRELSFEQFRANGVPFYVSPYRDPAALPAKTNVSLPKPMLLTVYFRDLDSSRPLREMIAGSKLTFAGIAYADLDLSLAAKVLLTSKQARVSLPVKGEVELQVPGGPLARKAAVDLLTVADAGWNQMGSVWQSTAKLFSDWRRQLWDQYAPAMVLAHATYDLKPKEGEVIHREATATGFQVGNRQVLLPKSVLEPWKFDAELLATMKQTKAEVAGYDLWIWPANQRLRDDSQQLAANQAWRLGAQQLRLLPSSPDDLAETFVSAGKKPIKVSVARRQGVAALGLVEITDPAASSVAPRFADANGAGIPGAVAWFRFPAGLEARDARPDLVFVSATLGDGGLKLDQLVDSAGWGSPLISKAGIVGVIVSESTVVPVAEVQQLLKPGVAGQTANREVKP